MGGAGTNSQQNQRPVGPERAQLGGEVGDGRILRKDGVELLGKRETYGSQHANTCVLELRLTGILHTAYFMRDKPAGSQKPVGARMPCMIGTKLVAS